MFFSICFNIIMFIFGIIVGASIVFVEAEKEGYGKFVKVKGQRVKRWQWSHEIKDKEE